MQIILIHVNIILVQNFNHFGIYKTKLKITSEEDVIFFWTKTM